MIYASDPHSGNWSMTISFTGTARVTFVGVGTVTLYRQASVDAALRTAWHIIEQSRECVCTRTHSPLEMNA